MPRRLKQHSLVPCECHGGCQRSRPLPATAKILGRLRLSFEAVLGYELPAARFCCPLCLRMLPDTCATLAHAPAERLGGSIVGVLCKACNSFTGHRFEAEMVAAARGAEGHHLVRVRPAGSQSKFVMRAEFEGSAHERNLAVTLEPAGKGPSVDRSMEQLRKLGGLGPPFGMSYRGTNATAGAGALLMWAYLLWFEHLGYSFALSTSLKRLRIAILTNSIDDLGRSPVAWRERLPTQWERGQAVLTHIEDGLAFGLGWEWMAATAILPGAFDPGARVYDVLDDLVERNPDSLTLGSSYYPVLQRIQFGLARDRRDRPLGITRLVEGRIVLAGASRSGAEAVLGDSLEPRNNPGEPWGPIEERPIPEMPHHLDAGSMWARSATEEARRVAADPSSINEQVEAAILSIREVGGGQQEKAWNELRLLVDDGVFGHLQDLWLYAVSGVEYDPHADSGGPDALLLAVRGVPKSARPQIRQVRSEDLPSAPGLYRSCLLWVRDGNTELIGPFFTMRSLIAAVRVRTHGMREALLPNGASGGVVPGE